MTTYDEMLEVIQAAKAGKSIQRKWLRWPVSGANPWQNTVINPNNGTIIFDFGDFDYRVKPEEEEEEPLVIWINEFKGSLGNEPLLYHTFPNEKKARESAAAFPFNYTKIAAKFQEII